MQAEGERGALRGAIEAGAALPWNRILLPFGRAAAWTMRLPFWLVFAVLLAGQWAVVGVIAAIATHNGFSFYSGGDDSWYYTSAWVLAHGHVPDAAVGYGVPVLLAPLALIAGPSLIAGLPLVVALNMLVLTPAALGAVYGIAKTIAGRGYAYMASLFWVVFPLVSIPYFYGRYHVRLVDQTLPQATGLVATAEFTAVVALLVASYLTVVAIARRSPEAALLAGLAAGFAIATKPSNTIYLPAPFAALAVARKWRELLLLAAGLVPAVVGLAVWKYRGLGTLPLFSKSAVALALGPSTPLASIRVHRYVHFDWSQLTNNMYFLREYTWSLRMITWVLAAGVIALWRRSAAVAVLICGSLACFIVFKATYPAANVSDGSFFRLMTPAFPAFFFELAALPLLVPVFGRRLAAIGRAQATGPASWITNRRTVWAGLAVSLIPIALFSVERPLNSPSAVGVPSVDQYAPANTFPLSATATARGIVELRWPSQDARGARAGYEIFREPWDGIICPGSHGCVFYSDPHPSMHVLNPVGSSATTSFRDRPGPGHWIYRVAATVALNGPRNYGNYLALSRRADVDVRVAG
jgi:hypothetical protein